MKRLTKKQRHQIYKDALALYLRLKALIGLCYVIRYSMPDDICIDYDPYANDFKYFPEIKKRKPKQKHSAEEWFPYEHTKIRIDILKQAIKETK